MVSRRISFIGVRACRMVHSPSRGAAMVFNGGLNGKESILHGKADRRFASLSETTCNGAEIGCKTAGSLHGCPDSANGNRLFIGQNARETERFRLIRRAK